MKINGLPGEFAFKALIRREGPYTSWEATPEYYFEQPHIIGYVVKWPVEVWDNGSVYIPNENELR